MAKRELIGFIGQGWIGKNYADDFEKRGFKTVRYGLESAYVGNRKKIATCSIVFIAVPTPTTPDGSDSSIVGESLKLIGNGKIAVIKSTLAPGTTEKFQKKFPHITILHSPEFLTTSTVVYDVAHPKTNTIGVPVETVVHRNAAAAVLKILPKAPIALIVKSRESELLKYVTNSFYYTKVVYMNMMYDLAQSLGCDWQPIRELLGADPWIGNMHLNPIHKTGRGAGGGCLVKDFASFRKVFEREVLDGTSRKVIEAIEKKNLELLRDSGKDQDVVKAVYGSALKRTKKK